MVMTRDEIYNSAIKIIKIIEELPKQKAETRNDLLSFSQLSKLRRLEPLGFGIEEVRNKTWFSPEECIPDVIWPIDVGLIVEKGGRLGDLFLANVKTINMKEARPYASRFSKFMIRLDYATESDGRLIFGSDLFAWINNSWIDATKQFKRLRESNNSQGHVVSASIAVALSQRYEWAISLSFKDTPSIRFATDPTGIKDMFRVRDLPEGKDRREALMTWITNHWRQKRHDPDMEIYVRKHLRGATQFNWKNMNIELTPSQFDIDKRDALIVEREAMRTVGTDRRSK
jgi:hypothetical protein